MATMSPRFAVSVRIPLLYALPYGPLSASRTTTLLPCRTRWAVSAARRLSETGTPTVAGTPSLLARPRHSTRHRETRGAGELSPPRPMCRGQRFSGGGSSGHASASSPRPARETYTPRGRRPVRYLRLVPFCSLGGGRLLKMRICLDR